MNGKVLEIDTNSPKHNNFRDLQAGKIPHFLQLSRIHGVRVERLLLAEEYRMLKFVIRPLYGRCRGVVGRQNFAHAR
jgi:hypothetical protein